jgi:hypothetical protein
MFCLDLKIFVINILFVEESISPAVASSGTAACLGRRQDCTRCIEIALEFDIY